MSTVQGFVFSGTLSNESQHMSSLRTRPSVTRREVIPISALNSIHRFHEEEIFIDKAKVLGRGVFGKCYYGSAGPQFVCVKVFRKDVIYSSSYNNEAYMLSQCCQQNIPFLFGLLSTFNGYKCLLTAVHNIDGTSYTVHSMLDKDVTLCWKNIFKE